jgi:hypothetical protein
MNFQAVRNVKGQKDDKGYPQKVDMIGVFVEVGGAAYTSNEKLYCDCYITDMSQEKHKVRLYIKELIPTGVLNTECSFSISAYDGEYQGKPYVGYSGFWNNKVVPRPAQGRQALQQPKLSPGVDVESQILAMAERFLTAIEGLVYPNATQTGPNPDHVGDDPSPLDDDDIPF